MAFTRSYAVVTSGFEAACKIDTLPRSHRASRLHGHGFQVKLRAAMPENERESSSKEPSKLAGTEIESLRAQLQQVLAPLDHRYLNDIIANPTNENIARYVRQKIGIEVDKIAVQSTPSEGVDIDKNGQAHVWRLFRFEAAHQLPNVPADHQCGRMHGHGFKVILHAHQNLGDAPMAVDIDALIALWQGLAPELEFVCLNDIPGLENPTSEHLAAWLWRRLKPKLAALSHISVYETATAGCHFDGELHRIWKDFRFESALKLSNAPKGDRRRCLHGHSYLVRLHVQAPLHKQLGWTIDYGALKAHFIPALARLDHHFLNDIADLENPSSAGIAAWIKSQLEASLPELQRVDCFEQTGCGAVLSWAQEGPALPI